MVKIIKKKNKHSIFCTRGKIEGIKLIMLALIFNQHVYSLLWTLSRNLNNLKVFWFYASFPSV